MDSTPKSSLNTSLKQNTDESKSRLTPCRRMGLKRKSVTPTSSTTTPSRKYLRTSAYHISDSPSVAKSGESEDSFTHQRSVSRVQEKCDVTEKVNTPKRCGKENKDQCTKVENLLSADEIFKLARKWKAACQDALRDLLKEYHSRGEKGTMGDLLNSLRIPFEIVSYSLDDEDFLD